MIKLESLPTKQDQKNAALAKDLRRLRYSLYALLLAATVGSILLYNQLPLSASGQTVVASRDGTVFGYAVFLGPQFAITDADIPSHVRITSGSRATVDGEKVRAEDFQENLTLTLIRTERPLPESFPAPLGTPDASLAITIAGIPSMESSLKRRVGSPYFDIESPADAGPGNPVKQRDSLVGITAEVKSQLVLVPVKYIMTKFAELGPSR